jgi:prophage DNA circulation protein
MPTLFEQLRPFKWRDVEFPVSQMGISLTQGQAPHRYYGRDGANIEATGRESLVFQATIPFRNGIVPGKAERWGILYPTTFQAFLVAMANTSRGTLQHPELGDVQVKPHTCTVHWDANRRDGCEVEASWIETVEDELDAVLINYDSPIKETELGALDLDAQYEDLSKLVPSLPAYQPTIADFLNGIAAIGDQFSLIKQRGTGSVEALVYRLQTVQDSIERARSPLTWPATDAIERIKAAAVDVQKTILAKQKRISLFQVKAAATLASISILLPSTSLGDLMKLNPSLIASPIIAAGTVIRYYT